LFFIHLARDIRQIGWLAVPESGITIWIDLPWIRTARNAE
jgi:hypothetical protein